LWKAFGLVIDPPLKKDPTGEALIAGVSIGIAVGGYAIGSAIASAMAPVATAAAGQSHHILSNPITNALNNHPTLRGLLDRAGSTVQALTETAHKGYQTWHRAIDSTMVQWLNNNPNATEHHFWQQMYNQYSTPDMIARFGQGALNYIKGMMK